MAANNINISDLTYEGIKSSLIDYLKTQTTFKDYNFEGSAIKTLVDLLSYNTFYYGYYLNMMAGEMFLDSAKLPNSLISLTKPLGYVVPGIVSAKATVKLVGLELFTELSPFSIFRGLDVSGRPYIFYNISPIKIGSVGNNSLGTDYFEIYEARSAIFRQLVDVDLEDQSFDLVDMNIDPRTIRIEVRYNGEDEYVNWKNYMTNQETPITSTTEIFFVERTKKGYKINFGKYTFSDSGSAGKQISSTDQVYISYLVSSGSLGNGIFNFSFLKDSLDNPIQNSSTSLEVYTASSGGSSQPSANQIRFFAPKTFSRQGRAVTKNDYVALLSELGYGSSVNTDTKFKVFGGEEATPPVHGRVFMSILNLVNSNEINQLFSALKQNSVVSILPEYVAPIEIRMYIDATFGLQNETVPFAFETAKTKIKVALSNKYSVKKFNSNVDNLSVLNTIKEADNQIQINSQDIKLYFSVDINSAENSVGLAGKKINVKNKLKYVSIPNMIVGYTAKTSSATGKYLYLYSNSNNSIRPDPVGEVDFENGVILIYPEKSSRGFTVEFEVLNDSFMAKDQIVCFIQDNTRDIILRTRELQ